MGSLLPSFQYSSVPLEAEPLVSADDKEIGHLGAANIQVAS